MSDPTPEGTVRGWLETLALAFGTEGLLSQVLAELRYMNTRLWGTDATGPEADPLKTTPLWEALFTLGPNVSGNPFYAPLGQVIGYHLGQLNQPRAYTYVDGLEAALDTLIAQTYDSGARLSAAELLASIKNTNEQYLSTIGFPVNGATVNAHLALLVAGIAGLQSQDAAQYAIQVGVYQAMTDYLECICENTSAPPADPGTPAYNPAGCDEELYPDVLLTAVLDFTTSTTDMTPQWVKSAGADSIAISQQGPDNFLMYNAVGTPFLGCVQLWIHPDDPGTYNVTGTWYDDLGDPGQNVQGFVMDAPPNTAQPANVYYVDSTTTTIYCHVVVNRVDGGDGFPATWNGVQPVLYLGGVLP